MKKPKHTPGLEVKIANIPEKRWAVVTVSQFLALLTGAYMAGFDRDGGITLRYTDNTRESATFPIEEAQRLYDNALGESPNAGWWRIVGAVQEKARAAIAKAEKGDA